MTIKVADFGESREIANIVNLTMGIGTYLWMAPEVVNHQNYTLAADVFSFGMVLWELFCRKLPERGTS
jgi:serine/threonine protein kinase